MKTLIVKGTLSAYLFLVIFIYIFMEILIVMMDDCYRWMIERKMENNDFSNLFSCTDTFLLFIIVTFFIRSLIKTQGTISDKTLFRFTPIIKKNVKSHIRNIKVIYKSITL